MTGLVVAVALIAFIFLLGLIFGILAARALGRMGKGPDPNGGQGPGSRIACQHPEDGVAPAD